MPMEGSGPSMSETTMSQPKRVDLTKPLDVTVWENTGSGKIFSQLSEIGKRENKQVQIAGKNTEKEIFLFGTEQAVLYKNLEGGTVGERDGVIIPSIESYDYKRLAWWKEAVTPVLPSLQLLDAPVLSVAKDAGIEHINDLDPKLVAKVYGFSQDEAGLAQAERKIIDALSLTLSPDYMIRNTVGNLRMVALTPEAVASRYEDNQIYQDALGKIKNAVPNLPALFSQQ